MRRRICLVGATLSAIPMAFGVSAATAASHKTGKVKPKGTPVTCKSATTVEIAQGDTQVTPPVSQGSEYGSVSCSKLFGKGVQSDQFNVPDSGDTAGKFTWYFHAGTVRGKYDLTPQEGSLNFLSTDYLGTITVTGGTGTFAGAKGVGTMTCSSADGIHMGCTDKLHIAKL